MNNLSHKQVQLPTVFTNQRRAHLKVLLLIVSLFIATAPNLGYFPLLFGRNQDFAVILMMCWLTSLVLTSVTAYLVFAQPPESGILNFLSFLVMVFTITCTVTGYYGVKQAIYELLL